MNSICKKALEELVKEENIGIVLHEPSQGGKALQKVSSISMGGDFDKNKLLIIPTDPLYSERYYKECVKKAHSFDHLFRIILAEYDSGIKSRSLSQVAREECNWRIEEILKERERIKRKC